MVTETQGKQAGINLRRLYASHKLASTICTDVFNVFLLWPNLEPETLVLVFHQCPHFFFFNLCMFMKYISNPMRSQAKESEQITVEFASFTLTNSVLSSPHRSQQLSGQLKKHWLRSLKFYRKHKHPKYSQGVKLSDPDKLCEILVHSIG